MHAPTGTNNVFMADQSEDANIVTPYSASLCEHNHIKNQWTRGHFCVSMCTFVLAKQVDGVPGRVGDCDARCTRWMSCSACASCRQVLVPIEGHREHMLLKLTTRLS
jgi:methionyl-tRNA synthetase